MLVEQENGKIKKITENYLLPAVSTLDAETKIHEYFKNVKLEYIVKSVSETNYIDVIE
jgi:hypothetical protein